MLLGPRLLGPGGAVRALRALCPGRGLRLGRPAGATEAQKEEGPDQKVQRPRAARLPGHLAGAGVLPSGKQSL